MQTSRLPVTLTTELVVVQIQNSELSELAHTLGDRACDIIICKTNSEREREREGEGMSGGMCRLQFRCEQRVAKLELKHGLQTR